MTIKKVIRFEVQTETIIDGWINTWHEDDEPQTFSTRKEAEDAIDEFFDDLKDAGMADDYTREDYRVMEQ
jgi:hypothetical protein